MNLMSEYSQKSAMANKFIIQFLDLNSVKQLPIFAGAWLLWFSSNAAKYRPAILQGYLGMFLGGAFSRIVQDLSPERLRPIHSGNPLFMEPLGVKINVLEHWSSFPSDHAAMFFAFSTALWLTSRPLGALCYCWSVFVVCIPRVFAGKHYATDVIAGAAIGILALLLAARPIANKIMPWIWAMEERHKAIFYAVFFVVSYQFCTMFDDVRSFGGGLLKEIIR
jgi:undecaprenyl-diphosphatase